MDPGFASDTAQSEGAQYFQAGLDSVELQAYFKNKKPDRRTSVVN